MFCCSGRPTASNASSALERILAKGLRRLCATAADISPSATKASLSINCFCCETSKPAARRTIQ
ncbi:hypothetical protein D3C87_2113380 [compost metagenome]